MTTDISLALPPIVLHRTLCRSSSRVGISRISWSPTGRWLASASQSLGLSEIRLWDLDGKGTRQFLADKRLTPYSLSWSPDERTVAIGDMHGVFLIDTLSGRLKSHFLQEESVGGVAFSPDGGRLAIGGPNQVISFWDVRGEPLGKASGHTGSVRQLAWQPNGIHVAAGTDDRT